MRALFGSALCLLGCWATFTTSATFRSPGGWRRHRALVVAGAVFTASCLLPGIALLAETFRPWMLVPLGVSYVCLVPLPCYFQWANRGRVRTARAILFFVIGAGLIALGVGWLPMTGFGF